MFIAELVAEWVNNDCDMGKDQLSEYFSQSSRQVHEKDRLNWNTSEFGHDGHGLAVGDGDLLGTLQIEGLFPRQGNSVTCGEEMSVVCQSVEVQDHAFGPHLFLAILFQNRLSNNLNITRFC